MTPSIRQRKLRYINPTRRLELIRRNRQQKKRERDALVIAAILG
jgi:hypothetical protein